MCEVLTTVLPVVRPATSTIETSYRTDCDRGSCTTTTYYDTRYLEVRTIGQMSQRTQASTISRTSTITASTCHSSSSMTRSLVSSKATPTSSSGLLGPPASTLQLASVLSPSASSFTMSLEATSVSSISSGIVSSAAVASTSSSASSGSSSQTWLPGVVGALAILLLAGSIALYYILRRRRRRAQDHVEAPTLEPDAGGWSKGDVAEEMTTKGREHDSWQCRGVTADENVPPSISAKHQTTDTQMQTQMSTVKSQESFVDPGPRPNPRKAVPSLLGRRPPQPIIVAQPPTPRPGDDPGSPFRQFIPLPMTEDAEEAPPHRSRLNIRSIAQFRLPSLTL